MNLILHIITKQIIFLINLLKIGNGSTIPGHILLTLNKDIFNWYAKKLNKGVVLVLGTNGKTTTTGLITHTLQNCGFKVITNNTGANLENGIISAFLSKFNLFTTNEYDYGVFEVDELNLEIIINKTKPLSIVFLNLTRDQLDRYAETDVIFNSWQRSIVKTETSKIFIYEKDETIINLSGKNIKLFKTENIFTPKLSGEFNKINLSAALNVCEYLIGEGERDKIIKHLNTFVPVFGRGETIDVLGNKVTILLNKNPESFNSNLQLVSELSLSYPQEKNKVVIGLNDNIADGKDTSWIYDVKPELFLLVSKTIDSFMVIGTRQLDIASRIKYSGINETQIEQLGGFENLLSYIKSQRGLNIYILPTYTAMLQIRSVLTNSKLGRSINK